MTTQSRSRITLSGRGFDRTLFSMGVTNGALGAGILLLYWYIVAANVANVTSVVIFGWQFHHVVVGLFFLSLGGIFLIKTPFGGFVSGAMIGFGAIFTIEDIFVHNAQGTSWWPTPAPASIALNCVFAISLATMLTTTQMSKSRSNLNVGVRTWFWSLLTSILLFGTLYVVFVVVGWTGLGNFFGGNLIMAGAAAVILLIFLILVSFYLLGWSARRAVGAH